MRLTLRTMLCYLDDVLDPADARELGAKIEESEYATNVVHRVRTSMRRLRLGAPPVSSEKGPGQDPNKVAEYLDNTLTAEEVPDFERACLDTANEAQLAEVAACHQILTLVLGEPAEVPPSMRHRVYGLAALDDQQLAAVSMAAQTEEPAPTATAEGNGAQHRSDAAAETPSAESASPEPASSAKRRSKPEVPAYLRQGRRPRIWPLALGVLLLAVVAGVLAMQFWPEGTSNEVAVNDADQGDDVTDLGDRQPPSSLFDVDADDHDAGAPEANGNNTEASGDQTSDETAEAEAAAGGNASANVPPAPPVPDEDGVNIAAADLVVTPDDESEATPVGEPRDDTAVASIDPRSDLAPPDRGSADLSPAPKAEPELPAVDKVVAHFISSGQLIGSWDSADGTWKRLPPRAALKPGNRLRLLPTYRPQVLLNNDIQITFAGEGIAAIGSPSDGVPAVELPVGKAVIATMGKAGNQLALQAGGRDVMLTMVNAEAVVAVRVTKFHLPGADPLSDMPHREIVATVTGGQVQWQHPGTAPVTLDVGQQIVMIDDSFPKVSAIDTMPKWIKGNDISDIDRLASATLEPTLDDDRPLEITLEERSEHPRVEVRSLAARCLAAIDKFDRIIDTFGDESLKSYWSEHFDRLQGALARGDDTAALVQTAVERRAAENAEHIFRLLQGYSPEQLKAGADKMLVESLSSESLPVRVLAINNLRRITGRTFGYHPHLPELRRRTPVREWEQAASRGTIAYLDPPPELPKREAAAEVP